MNQSNGQRNGSSMKASNKGFTLIELMITMVVIAVIAAIAIPSYGRYVQRSARAEAATGLREASVFMQRFYAMNSAYDQKLDGTALALPASLQQTPSQGVARYVIDLANLTATGFTLRATPQGGQVGDGCGTLTLTNTGQRTASDAGTGSATTRCWR